MKIRSLISMFEMWLLYVLEIDVSDIARVSLSVKLENKKFTADLTDKSTAAYQLLKTKVAGAVSSTIRDCNS